jgi:hypothetical protein
MSSNYVVCVRKHDGAEWVADSAHFTNKAAYARADAICDSVAEVCVLSDYGARQIGVEIPAVGWSYV